jgi:hypothetical protein
MTTSPHQAVSTSRLAANSAGQGPWKRWRESSPMVGRRHRLLAVWQRLNVESKVVLEPRGKGTAFLGKTSSDIEVPDGSHIPKSPRSLGCGEFGQASASLSSRGAVRLRSIGEWGEFAQIRPGTILSQTLLDSVGDSRVDGQIARCGQLSRDRSRKRCGNEPTLRNLTRLAD